MKKIPLTLLFTAMPILPVLAGVEFGGGVGYTSFDFTDRGGSKYTLKNSNYSGPIYHGFALFNFGLNENATLGLGGIFEASSMKNDVIYDQNGWDIDIGLKRFAAQGKISLNLVPLLTPYGKLDIGYETWQINSTGTFNGEFGSFKGSYAIASVGTDLNLGNMLRIFGEVGVTVGYQIGRFADPNSSINAPMYYELQSRTRGFQARGGLSFRF